VNDASNWRLTTTTPASIKQGGLIRSSFTATDLDGAARPRGFAGDTGWSLGAYQQSN
jgi:hypothetical protein